MYIVKTKIASYIRLSPPLSPLKIRTSSSVCVLLSVVDKLLPQFPQKSLLFTTFEFLLRSIVTPILHFFVGESNEGFLDRVAVDLVGVVDGDGDSMKLSPFTEEPVVGEIAFVLARWVVSTVFTLFVFGTSCCLSSTENQMEI